jgi:hypothetical protein
VIDRPRGRQRLLAADVQEGAQRAVRRGDAVQVRLGDLGGRHLTRRDRRPELGSRQPGQFRVHDQSSLRNRGTRK